MTNGINKFVFQIGHWQTPPFYKQADNVENSIVGHYN